MDKLKTLDDNEHKLNSQWQFWYSKRSVKTEDYKDKLRKVFSADTVEGFFKAYAFMKLPTDMPREYDLFFTRGDKHPMWEEYPHGGTWIFKIRKTDNADLIWEKLLLSCIGEQFENLQVVGVALSLRIRERLAEVWIQDASNSKTKAAVSNKIRHLIEFSSHNVTMYFKAFSKAISDNSTMKNAEGFKFVDKENDTKETIKQEAQK